MKRETTCFIDCRNGFERLFSNFLIGMLPIWGYLLPMMHYYWLANGASYSGPCQAPMTFGFLFVGILGCLVRAHSRIEVKGQKLYLPYRPFGSALSTLSKVLLDESNHLVFEFDNGQTQFASLKRIGVAGPALLNTIERLAPQCVVSLKVRDHFNQRDTNIEIDRPFEIAYHGARSFFEVRASVDSMMPSIMRAWQRMGLLALASAVPVVILGAHLDLLRAAVPNYSEVYASYKVHWITPYMQVHESFLNVLFSDHFNNYSRVFTSDPILSSRTVCATAFFCVILGARLLLSPNRVRIDNSCLSLVSVRSGITWFSRRLRWNTLTSVRLSKARNSASVDRWSIMFFCGESKSPRLTLSFSGIKREHEQRALIAAVEKYAPGAAIDPVLLEQFRTPHTHSYTELWLQSLSSPPKRERLTPLQPGQAVNGGAYVIVQQLAVGGQGTAYVARDRKNVKAVSEVPQGAGCRDASQAGRSRGNGAAENACNEHVARNPQEEENNDEGLGSNRAVGESASLQNVVVLKEFVLPVYVEKEIRRQALEKFQREARTLQELNHPQIVRLKDYFIEDHRAYLVLEHIAGRTLRKVVEEDGAMSEPVVRELTAQMCEILSYLHTLEEPITHRDFTPDNLILGVDGKLKLIDFDVARKSDNAAKTSVVGKHAFIPPEQFRGRPTTQSDIFAMGATVFFLLTGTDPEPLTKSVPRLLNPEVSEEFDAIVQRATELELANRFATAQEVVGALTRQEVPGQYIAAQEMPAQEMPGRHMAAQEMPGQHIAAQDMPGQGIVAQDTPGEYIELPPRKQEVV